MSNNISRKLEIKAELLRHMVTAQEKLENNEVSSVVKVLTLQLDLHRFEARGVEPDLQLWRRALGE